MAASMPKASTCAPACAVPTRSLKSLIGAKGTPAARNFSAQWAEGWRAMINRWERLDTARTWAAVAAFGLFLAAAALR